MENQAEKGIQLPPGLNESGKLFWRGTRMGDGGAWDAKARRALRYEAQLSFLDFPMAKSVKQY